MKTLATVVCLLLSAPVWAGDEQVIRATIEAIDLKAETMTIKRPKTGTLVKISWDEGTKMYLDGEAIDEKKLAKGQLIHVVIFRGKKDKPAIQINVFVENEPPDIRDACK